MRQETVTNEKNYIGILISKRENESFRRQQQQQQQQPVDVRGSIENVPGGLRGGGGRDPPAEDCPSLYNQWGRSGYH